MNGCECGDYCPWCAEPEHFGLIPTIPPGQETGDLFQNQVEPFALVGETTDPEPAHTTTPQDQTGELFTNHGS